MTSEEMTAFVRGAILVLVVGTMSLTACRSDVGDAERLGSARARQALAPAEPDVTFELRYPAGSGFTKAAIGASERLELGPGDRIVGVTGAPGSVASVGGDTTAIGSGTNVGDVISLASVSASPKVTATSIRSSGVVTLAPNDHVGEVTERATLDPFVRRTMVVHPPAGPGSEMSIEPGEQTTIAPGRYGRVSIGPNANVTLSGGTYLIDSLTVSPNAELRLDTEGGSIFAYVTTAVRWDGAVTGDASRFVFGYLGEGTLDLERPLRGTVLVPSGTLKLGASQTHEGKYYAHHVIVGPDAIVKEIATPFLIDELNVARTTVCIGEETEVTLTGATTISGATPRILGVVGPHQFVAFSDAPGPRSIGAAIFTPDGRADFTSVPITVRSCTPAPDAPQPVAFHFWGAQAKPNVVELAAHGYDPKGHETAIAGPATYAWTFGDGTTSTTTSPVVVHDYRRAVDPTVPYSYFPASVTVTTASGSASAHKIVPIFSLYALNRSKGLIQPPTTLAVASDAMTATLTNYEPSPLTITTARIDLTPCDPALDVRRQAAQPLSVQIPASGTGTVTIEPPSDVPYDICGMNVHLMGATAAGAVYASKYTRVGENKLVRRHVTDQNAVALLNQAATLTSDPNRFDEFELRALVAAGKLPGLPPSIPPGTTYANPDEGKECTPGDVHSPPGLACQPTENWVAIPSEIVNAFRGDIVMDHGCGEIGQLLAAINQTYSHESIFTKRGVEVRHSTAKSERLDEHFDVTGLRIDPTVMKYVFPGTDGKTGTFTVDQMVHRFTLKDPEDSDKLWDFDGTLNINPSLCDHDLVPALPVVVRPPPDVPVSITNALSAMGERGGEPCSSDGECASASCNQAAGRCNPGSIFSIDSHYRFFMYSHAEKTLPGSSWASGTESTVSSTFMHLAPFRAGFPLRPSLAVNGVPDGMRRYSVDERIAAGDSLWTNVANQAHAACRFAPDAGVVLLGGAAGLLGGPDAISIGADLGEQAGNALCADIAGNIANQTANCFASDACDDLGDGWRAPGAGATVSPDDILAWDPPSKGGTYGLNEPAYYLPLVFRREYVWKPVAGAGTFTVKVLDENDAAFPGAQVILNGVPLGVTDASGTLVAQDVAPGDYDVEAQYSPCGPFVPGTQPAPPSPDSLPICPREGPVPAVCGSGYGGGACPRGFDAVTCVEGNCSLCSGGTCGNDAEHTSDPNAEIRCERNCVCRAKEAPACNQPLLRAAKPATLSASGSTRVVLTLCAGPYVNNGTTCTTDLQCPAGNTCKVGYCYNAAGCRQHCETDADCFNTLTCDHNQNDTCVPRPSIVKVFDGVNLQIYDHNLFESPTRRQYSLFNDLVCDPSINGGKASFIYCGLDADGDATAQYVFEVTCTQDPTDGHLTVTNDARLDEGCGSDAERRNNTVHWVVALPPDNGSAGPYTGGQSCWSTCDENHAYFEYSYTSERK